MPDLFGRKIGKEQLIASVGELSQVCGIDSFEYDDGLAKGVKGLDVRTGSGLRFTVLPGRGMDIFRAEYRGIPLVWCSGTGVVNPHMYSAKGWDWLRNFTGGLLMTCGLSNVGGPCTDKAVFWDDQEYGAHGRISNIPARNVNTSSYWQDENYVLEIEGEVVEATGQGENFLLSRRIKTEMASSTIQINDVVKNRSFYRVAHMFMYHINLGYPLVSKDSELYLTESHYEPMDEVAQKTFDKLGQFNDPDIDGPEEVFIGGLKKGKSGFCAAAFINKQLNDGKGLGIYLKYPQEQFPYMNYWKRLNKGEYLIGLEPGNCTVLGRSEQRKRGDLKHLEPQEEVKYDMEIGILGSREEIDEFIEIHGLDKL